MSESVLHIGDCREVMAQQGPFDMIVADPPYGETSLRWDRRLGGWHAVAAQTLKSSGSLWVFGSLKFFLAEAPHFEAAGFRYAQEIVWKKANGTGFAADRFKRVHELAVQWIPKASRWSRIYNDVQREPATHQSKSVRIRHRNHVQHAGQIEPRDYVDDGLRIVKSVVEAPSVRGGIHKTQKPVEIISLLIQTSCVPGGLVGDFFAGSASAGVAAMQSGRRYIGCEIDPDMAARAKARLLAQSTTLGENA